MTIDEALSLLNEKISCDYNLSGCASCDISSCTEKDLYNQLAEWLEELKDYRDKNKMVVRIDVKNTECIKDALKEQYNKAIDDFVEKAIIMIDAYDGLLLDKRAIEHIRAELKAGVVKNATTEQGD